MKRRNIFLVALFMVFSISIFGQQESQYTQYMYNTILVNPGYAGSRGVMSVFGMHRAQWVGIEGAPQTSILSLHMPFESKKVGLGASLYHESLGPQTTNTIMIDFSYALEFDNDSKLAFGLKGTAGFYNLDRSKLRLFDTNDTWFAENADTSLFHPNVGAGIYWYSDNYYLGVSVPNLLSTELLKRDKTTIATVNNIQHLYFIGGYVFDFSDNVKFKPAVLSKLVQGAPIQLDLSANFMFNDKFVIGGAWRWSAAASLMAGFQINRNWFIGYAYDYETTDLRKYNSGSHEIFLRYEFIKDVQKIISPRFF